MLASTVKFSRYGRAQNIQHPTGHHQSLVRKRALQKTTDPSGPNSVLRPRSTHQLSTPTQRQAVLTEQASQWPQVNVPHSGSSPDRKRSLRNQAMDNPTKKRDCQKLLRKEVIQPHLPVRLPCYDLVLIIGPTFDSSLPYGLGHRLRVLPTFMT